MGDNAQKTWLARTLNIIAEGAARNQIQVLGKALPASIAAIPVAGVPIVTVKFELTGGFTLPNVTVPLFGPEWIRYPIAVGTKGVVFPADASLGGMSGLGQGTADLSMPANLSALVFFPIGNKDWTASEAPNSLVLYGPDGVILRDGDSKTVQILTANGMTMNFQAGDGLTINGKLHVTGPITFDGNVAITGSLSAASAAIAGALTANTISAVNATLTGFINAATGTITGDFHIGGEVFANIVSAVTGFFSNDVVAGTVALKAHRHFVLVFSTPSTTLSEPPA